jgi:predicted peptidase
MSRSLSIIFAVGLSLLFAPALWAADDASAAQPGQHAAVFQQQKTIKFDYLLSLPPDYNDKADQKWPLIFFLHGSGESGSDVNQVKKHGPPKIIENTPRSSVATQFIVVSPQCPDAGRGWKPEDLILLLDDVQAKYRVDPDRVYLTGLSMGGFGTWDLATAYPDRFAAIAPMCGGGNPARANRLRKLPIWIFHGGADPTVPVRLSEDMAEALKKLNADVTFTKYPGVGHDCWTQSYNNAELYRWFLSHKRSEEKSPKPAAEAEKK